MSEDFHLIVAFANKLILKVEKDVILDLETRNIVS